MMHTTKDLLPAINSLYDFGLTAQEMENLVVSLNLFTEEKVEDTEKYTRTSMDKLKNKTIDSITTVFRKNNILLEHTEDHSYNRENIRIYKLDEEDDASLIEKLEESKLYYVLNMYRDKNTKLRHNVILFESLKKSDLEQLSIIQFFMGDMYRDLDVPYLNLSSSSSATETYGFSVFKNAKKLEQLHKKEFFNLENLNKRFSKVDLTVKQLGNIIQKLYPDAQVEHGNLDKDSRRLLKINHKLRYIFSVFELHNQRIAVSINFDSYYDDDNIQAEVAVIPHTDSTYNYVDVARLWYKAKRRGYGYDQEHRPFGDVMFIGEDPSLPRDEVMRDYIDKNSGEVQFLDNHTLALVAKRYLQKQHRLKAEEDAKSRLRDKIQSKLDALKTEKGTLKINDVVYTKDKITYQDQELIGNGDDWVYSLLRYETNAYALDQVTFDGIFSSFISKTRKDDGHYGYTSGKVGSVSFDIESQVLTNKLNISSTRWKINGHRVNTKEIHKCIERAICFEEQTDFDYFLKSVSSCSLKMHRYLQLGLDISVRDHFDNTEVVLKFPLERIKNLNYLVLNDTEYKIRNTEKLLRLERAETIIDVINTLLSGEVVEGVTAEDVKDLIDAGKQAYISALEKSKELLENCEKVLGVQQERIELKDGNSFTGYRIKGNLRDYVVNAKDERYSVYDADSAAYICIVDKTNAAQAGLDRLVNRLFALHNDSRVATQITTLKRRS